MLQRKSYVLKRLLVEHDVCAGAVKWRKTSICVALELLSLIIIDTRKLARAKLCVRPRTESAEEGRHDLANAFALAQMRVYIYLLRSLLLPPLRLTFNVQKKAAIQFYVQPLPLFQNVAAYLVMWSVCGSFSKKPRPPSDDCGSWDGSFHVGKRGPGEIRNVYCLRSCLQSCRLRNIRQCLLRDLARRRGYKEATLVFLHLIIPLRLSRRRPKVNHHGSMFPCPWGYRKILISSICAAGSSKCTDLRTYSCVMCVRAKSVKELRVDVSVQNSLLALKECI
jgi:hypothetical protein